MLVDISGAQIYFDTVGSSLAVRGGTLVERPTIIAIHGGLGFDHGYLRPGFDELRSHAQVIFVDLRGHGRSSRPALDSCTLEQMADDVANLCQRLGVDQPIIFGHSAGGFVALHTALRHPEIIGGLILCNSSASMAPTPDGGGDPAPSLAARGSSEALAIAERVFGGEITEETISAFLRSVMPFYAAPANMTLVQGLLDLCTPNIAMMRHFMQVLAPHYDLRSRLEAIEVPTLVIAGSYDWVCPPRASRLIARSLPNAKLVELTQSGHFPFSEEPRNFLDAVMNYLRSARDPLLSNIA